MNYFSGGHTVLICVSPVPPFIFVKVVVSVWRAVTKNQNSAAGGIRSLDRMTVLWNYDHYSQTAHISLVVQMSVCLYAIITARNITCTMNTSRHFAFESTISQSCLRKICSHQQPPRLDDYRAGLYSFRSDNFSVFSDPSKYVVKG